MGIMSTRYKNKKRKVICFMGQQVENLEAYQVVERRKISDLNSEGYILKHKKTNAAVTLLLNDDENKVFYIGFRTPPKNSTGVAHILEHSVLCGSKNFPVKDPFIELAKGSLNTFLNAITYPDKTIYPVASCNDKDFQNLMDRLENVKKAYSKENEWLKTFQRVEIPEELELQHVKKWVEKIVVSDFREVHVYLTMQKWKNYFPDEWLEG